MDGEVDVVEVVIELDAVDVAVDGEVDVAEGVIELDVVVEEALLVVIDELVAIDVMVFIW